ncbi:MAG TPA: hypothetical protein PKW90_18725 [Myxococcota bacterium]|nr:hypothetical protein [Myxococcota bacterium]
MSETPAPKGAAVLRKLAAGGQILTAISIYASGLLGILVVEILGPYLGMGVQMYLGNTEPRQPEVHWPLGIALLLGLLPIPPLVTKRWSLTLLACIPFALLPWWQLYQLSVDAGK